MLKRIGRLLLALLLFPFALTAQETNSSITGAVKSSKGEALVGATITATHTPTGTVYRVASRAGGRFNIYNLRPGGPYTIVVSFVGFDDEKKDEVFLNLGEASSQDFVLKDKSSSLTEVVVVSRRAPVTGKGGTESSIGREKMTNLPSVGRNLTDFLKAVPQAKLTNTDGGISIGGQNNRYNSFYVDGAINNDVFGLAASGTNGGQTTAPPISIDAIDQLQVIIAPYDASIGNFTGGGINAVTRSGTNTVQGSVWYYFRNQNTSGKSPVAVPKAGFPTVVERTKLPNFANKTTGFRIGGPIVKNKLFYFILGEIQRDERPQPFNFADYRGTTNTIAGIEALSNFLKSTYNYDPGSYLDNPDLIEADRITTKLDWNINDNNKLSVSYRYNSAFRNNVSASNSTRINFYNAGYVFPNKTHSGSIELKSNFAEGTTNRLLLTYTDVEDDRGPIGGAFPNILITDGSAGSFQIGTEFSSTQNYLRQKNVALINTLKFIRGKHVISIGTDNELSKSYNVFIQGSYGAYTYNSLADFYNNARPARYQRNFALLDGVVTDQTKSAAKFNTVRIGFFLNDEIKVNDQFTLSLGVRADNTEFLTKPITDPFFNDTALAKISQYYDLQGARSGQAPNIPWSVSPRAGFTYKMNEEGITIRGGLGLFTGRIPLVWPGGIYNSNGISVGGINVANPNISFRPDPAAQYTAQDFGLNPQRDAKGSMNLISKTFRLPKIFKTSLAVDKRLGDGWTASFEMLFSKTINDVYYKNVNILPPSFAMAGPDNRPVYDTSAAGPLKIPIRNAGVRNPYDNVLLLTNARGRRAFSYTFTALLDKAWRNGFGFTTSYSWGTSVVMNEATSSVNTSQWRFMEAVRGRNNIELSQSDFSLGHRIFTSIIKKFEYAKKSLATTVTVTYNGQSGAPFSYVYLNSPVNDDGRAGGNQNNDLLFIPTTSQVQSMIFDANTLNGITYSQQQQRDMLEDYILKDKYLRNNRGKYAERNGSRLPFTHLIDLKVAQDFNLKFGGRTYSVQVAWEVSNFTNMLNKDWGRTWFLLNDNFRLLSFRGFVSTNPANASFMVPRYQFSPFAGKPWGVNASTVPGYSARWLSQFSARINF